MINHSCPLLIRTASQPRHMPIWKKHILSEKHQALNQGTPYFQNHIVAADLTPPNGRDPGDQLEQMAESKSKEELIQAMRDVAWLQDAP